MLESIQKKLVFIMGSTGLVSGLSTHFWNATESTQSSTGSIGVALGAISLLGAGCYYYLTTHSVVRARLYYLIPGTDVNAADGDRRTALHYAVKLDDELLLKDLISRGANVDATFGHSDMTALHGAAFRGHGGIVTALLAAGADVDFADKDGKTALHGAAFRGHGGIVDALLAVGADVNAADKEGKTALHLAILKYHDEHYDKCYKPIVDALLAAGASVDAVDQNGNTALFMAIYNNHEMVINALLAAGADVNAFNEGGGTALLGAAFIGNEKVVNALLTAGADVHAEKEGRTALFGAAVGFHKKIACILSRHMNKAAILAQFRLVIEEEDFPPPLMLVLQKIAGECVKVACG